MADDLEVEEAEEVEETDEDSEGSGSPPSPSEPVRARGRKVTGKGPTAPEPEPEVEEVDLDALIDAKVNERLARIGGSASSASVDVKAAVRDVLAEQKHEESHRHLDEPPPPKARKGLGKLIWG